MKVAPNLLGLSIGLLVSVLVIAWLVQQNCSLHSQLEEERRVLSTCRATWGRELSQLPSTAAHKHHRQSKPAATTARPLMANMQVALLDASGAIPMPPTTEFVLIE
eukprot:3393594-Prymnesium_polylepis.1